MVFGFAPSRILDTAPASVSAHADAAPQLFQLAHGTAHISVATIASKIGLSHRAAGKAMAAVCQVDEFQLQRLHVEL